jgi:hypothetical protein
VCRKREKDTLVMRHGCVGSSTFPLPFSGDWRPKRAGLTTYRLFSPNDPGCAPKEYLDWPCIARVAKAARQQVKKRAQGHHQSVSKGMLRRSSCI